MIFSAVFERFIEDSPITVMTQAILENALPPATVDHLFEDYAGLQYTRKLLFSDVVDLMSTVVCGIRPSINSAFKKMAPTMGVTKKAVYDKIDRVETTTSSALVRHTAAALTPVIDELKARKEPWLEGYRVRILDGNHLPGTEHRIGPLRTTRAGALPGHALVVGPIIEMASVSITKTAAHGMAGQGMTSSAHTPTSLGTLREARSHIEPGIGRG